jgi:hypothetical protein
MSFKCKSLPYVFILAAMGLGGTESSIQAMKRVREAEEGVSALLGNTGCTISDLTADPLRIIFAKANKATIVQVCKAWNVVANFKKNWKKFCNLASETSVLDPRDYIRMYYLLLKDNDVTRMQKLLSIDPYKTLNFRGIAGFLHKQPSAIAQSSEMRTVLENNQVLVLEGNFPSRAGDEDRIELNEILLRNDDQALQQFIEEDKDNAESPYEIACFGTYQAVERLLACWKTKKYNKNKATPYDEVLGHLMTNLAGECSNEFNMPCRISILELLLKNGADTAGGEDTAKPLTTALYAQDYQALKLLCEYEEDVNDSEACSVYFDSSGEIRRWWEKSTENNWDHFYLSPLMYGIYSKVPRIVALFLKHGANAFEVNPTIPLVGDVLEFAKTRGNQEIVDLIEVARAVEKNVAARLIKAGQKFDTDSE